ncbi:MAG: transposase [Acidobacteriota bacterium]
MQGRYLLPASNHFRSIAIGIMARAKERYPVEIYAFSGLRNHIHWLLGAYEVDDLSNFVGYVKSNLAREAGRIVDWREKFWARRFKAIEISNEEEAWVGRLRYVLSHGPKENLVLRCRDWPGLQCIDAVTRGEPLTGLWRDRTSEYEGRRRGIDLDTEAFVREYTLELDPPPCWRHLSSDAIQQRFLEMVEEIDAESARRVMLGGMTPLGARAIRQQHPHDRPERSKRSPAPAVHAASKAIRKQMKEAYRIFVEAYCAAAARLRAGDYGVEFPSGCFPPPRPFVPCDAGLPSCRAGPSFAPG